jgi:hypothetical protein
MQPAFVGLDYRGKFNFEWRIPYRKYVTIAADIQMLKIV